MKQIVTKDEIATAMADLTAKGKRPTLTAIHAAIGNKGSMSTVVKLKAEVEAAQMPADSPESLQVFRSVWAQACEEGRKGHEGEVSELKNGITVLSTENDRLEGLIMASQTRIGELEVSLQNAEDKYRATRDHQELELAQAKDAAIRANAESGVAYKRLAEVQTDHATKLAALQSELDLRIGRICALESALARANALLEVQGGSFPADGPRNADQLAKATI